MRMMPNHDARACRSQPSRTRLLPVGPWACCIPDQHAWRRFENTAAPRRSATFRAASVDVHQRKRSSRSFMNFIRMIVGVRRNPKRVSLRVQNRARMRGFGARAPTPRSRYCAAPASPAGLHSIPVLIARVIVAVETNRWPAELQSRINFGLGFEDQPDSTGLPRSEKELPDSRT